MSLCSTLHNYRVAIPLLVLISSKRPNTCTIDLPPMRTILSYERGTIRIAGDAHIPQAKFDSRSGCYRALAYTYRDNFIENKGNELIICPRALARPMLPSTLINELNIPNNTLKRCCGHAQHPCIPVGVILHTPSCFASMPRPHAADRALALYRHRSMGRGWGSAPRPQPPPPSF